jgi:hypothetical protein
LTDARLLLRASVDLIRVDLALRRSGLQPIMVEADQLATRDEALVDSADIRRARRYSRRIAWAARCNLPRAQCLHRSLVLHRWLREEGLPSQLRIGVLKEGNRLKAHAWVELADAIVNDRRTATRVFTPLRQSAMSTSIGSSSNRDARSVEWS